ncbi:hypothetical protein MUK42_32703 [Musa troglodytarum]|uniref:Uncharacterized protein n=1 Tax=Musa troglodytarum TaxID=320322 RepID=A0A9E7JTY3_9LILI|nr:hypothetical protein MUK42_32703 [Musa troglodytarum]
MESMQAYYPENPLPSARLVPEIIRSDPPLTRDSIRVTSGIGDVDQEANWVPAPYNPDLATFRAAAPMHSQGSNQTGHEDRNQIF